MNRRNAFKSLLAAPALTGIAAAGFIQPETLTAAPAVKPEGHSLIIKARNEYFSARAELDRRSLLPSARPGHPDFKDNDAHMDVVFRKMKKTLAFLASVPAQNMVELRAKADVAEIETPDYVDVFDVEKDADEMKISLSVIADVVRLCPTLA
ncbi:hypothetical protein HK17_09700 [Acetobacter indonesiensis]|uniref:Uncharacterized protein n=2 Tax=Acetobacter indonesiensis TaxID=104101 RepID=A0A252AS10_9PROT|nr:hypothetical protein HK17_09700 [Acetobacter indonesiensis]